MGPLPGPHGRCRRGILSSQERRVLWAIQGGHPGYPGVPALRAGPAGRQSARPAGRLAPALHARGDRPRHHPAGQGAGLQAPGGGRPVRGGDGYQQLRDRADRPGLRHQASDRDRAGHVRRQAGQRVHRRGLRRAEFPRGQDRPRGAVAQGPRHPVGRLRHHDVLQRFRQRPAPAGKGQRADRRQSRRPPAPPCGRGRLAHHGPVLR